MCIYVSRADHTITVIFEALPNMGETHLPLQAMSDGTPKQVVGDLTVVIINILTYIITNSVLSHHA